MKKDKSFYALLSVAIITWIAVIVLLGVFVQRTNQRITDSIIIAGNSNTVIVHSEDVKKHQRVDKQITAYSLRVLEATTAWTKDFTLDESLKLTKKIKKAALNNHLKLEEAFCIVHIESDFRIDAFNKSGKAYGLCQVTKPCLDEYNWKHGTDYSLQDMFNPDLNLEIGFWYYNRLIYHYGEKFGITLTNEWTLLRDAYIAYNIGITKFSDIGKHGRNELRSGRYPCAMYGSKKGDKYQPYFRFVEKAKVWVKN